MLTARGASAGEGVQTPAELPIGANANYLGSWASWWIKISGGEHSERSAFLEVWPW